MDALDILEAMAANATFDSGIDDNETIAKWRNLFGYTADEARKKIEEQRDDLTSIVSEALWVAVGEQQIALGHDRDSYSHWLRLPCQQYTAAQSRSTPDCAIVSGRGENVPEQHFLLRLEGPISTAAQVAEIAGVSTLPKIFEGTSESSTAETTFCKIDSAAKNSILTWLREHHPSFIPLFVLRSLAPKDLDAMSISPTLGRDASLPQHRLLTNDAHPRPAQEEYPVWYFFYGTLADQEKLHALFQHLDGEAYDPENYELRPARVAGARLETCGDKYLALVDGEDEVDGWAFLVASEAHEEALRSYETSAYEVVRCAIRCGEEILQGCTFRRAGG